MTTRHLATISNAGRDENSLESDFLRGVLSRGEAVQVLMGHGFEWFEAHEWLDNLEGDSDDE